MAEVFSSSSPCMLGKRVLSPHSHSSTLMGGQLDFSSKKRRLGQGAADQGTKEQSPSPAAHAQVGVAEGFFFPMVPRSFVNPACRCLLLPRHPQHHMAKFTDSAEIRITRFLFYPLSRCRPFLLSFTERT